MASQCAQCMRPVHPGLGYTAHTTELLCGPCYFALWRPRDGTDLGPVSEPRRPESRRPERPPTTWITGPTAELDPRFRSGLPRGLWRRLRRR